MYQMKASEWGKWCENTNDYGEICFFFLLNSNTRKLVFRVRN